MAELIYKQGEPDEVRYRIGDAAVSIGRSEDQAICIPHWSLSRAHAYFEPVGGRFFVVDLESKNGTTVNGTKIHRREVRHGDRLAFGDVEMVFTAEASPSRPSLRPVAEPRPQAIRPLTQASIESLPRSAGGASTGPETVHAQAQLRLAILIEVTKLLPVSDDLDTLLHKILDCLFRILDVDRGVVLLPDPQTGKLAPRIVKTSVPSPEGPRFSQNIVDYVVKNSVAALFADAAHDPRLDSAQSIVVQSIRASMCVPLKPKDEIIGVLYVDNLTRPRRFVGEDLDVFVAFASQAAVAIENAALYRRLEDETVTRMRLIMEAKLNSLSGLVAGIAHELRNPLNFMTNFAELSVELADEVADTAHRPEMPPALLGDLREPVSALRESSAKILEHGRRASAIIEGMLEHARRPSGQRGSADLNAVLAESLRLALATERGRNLPVKVTAHYDPSISPMEIAALDMGRVFVSVIDNALHALRDKRGLVGTEFQPELRVVTAGRGDRVEIRIRDNGVGIPADVQARIYDPFFTTRPPGRGTGLGLSLAHEIVTIGHQGTIVVASDPGRYTEFTIAIPLRISLLPRAPGEQS